MKYHVFKSIKSFKLLIKENLIKIKLVLVLQILDKNYAKEILNLLL